MAEARTERQPGRREQGLSRQPRGGQELQRWSAAQVGDPLEFFNRMTEELDRTFDRLMSDFGTRRRSWLPRGLFSRSRSQQGVWAPRIEALQQGDQFLVRAELPGLKRDDVQVELTDEALTIRGERREEREEEREGYFHSEREYGEFCRVVPLPEGAIGESAEATFRDGILEVRMQAPPAEANRGRRIEIREPSPGERKS